MASDQDAMLALGIAALGLGTAGYYLWQRDKSPSGTPGAELEAGTHINPNYVEPVPTGPTPEPVPTPTTPAAANARQVNINEHQAHALALVHVDAIRRRFAVQNHEQLVGAIQHVRTKLLTGKPPFMPPRSWESTFYGPFYYVQLQYLVADKGWRQYMTWIDPQPSGGVVVGGWFGGFDSVFQTGAPTYTSPSPDDSGGSLLDKAADVNDTILDKLKFW